MWNVSKNITQYIHKYLVFLLQRTITCYLWNVSKNIIQYIHKCLVFLLQRTIICYLWNVSKNIIQYIHKYLCVSLTAYNNLLFVECIKEYNTIHS